MFGGILRTGTWWIFSLGLVYSILRIKVPYIPTPKDDKPRNNYLLNLPNLAVCLISLGAIYYTQVEYGHLYDNPYVQMMALFALVNVTILGSIVMIGQEKWMFWIKTNIVHARLLQPVIMPLRLMIWRTRHGFYSGIRYMALAITMLATILSISFLLLKYNTSTLPEAKAKAKSTQQASKLQPLSGRLTNTP